MCVVDVEGAPRPLPACATRVRERDGRLDELHVAAAPQDADRDAARRAPEPDPGGRPNELLDLAAEYGAEAPFVLPDAKREPYDDRNRLMGYEPDTCILCNRCVRYTQEVMQCSALSLEGRGGEARIVPTWGKSLARHRLRAVRRLPLRLPDRRDLREVPRGRRRRGARARADEDDLHVLRRRLPARPERRSRRRGGSSRSPRSPRTSRTRATSASRAASPSTSSTTPTASPSRSCAARTASCTRRRGSTRCRSPPTA